ncbi:hypothetical protein Bca52824_076207 [Brassica carinata]|uniref:Uncharacterized protein n=1 Tax=Brassica carinata TaxID=52824 RepID=A0A8X7PTR8_BRACI|nr:hypothetical protein Bca52824_076207 [Brassica carinata]
MKSLHLHTHLSLSIIGVEFATQTLKVDEKVIKAQIWGTAGQERLRFLVFLVSFFGTVPSPVHTTVEPLVYDTTRRATIENVDRWFKEPQEPHRP